MAGVNRFDFLRLAFASTVFVYHAIALTGISAGGSTETLFAALAELSIQGFFIVSGALVFGSLERSGGLWTYGEKRLRRLYPAYLVIIFIPVLASLIITSGQAGALGEIWHYAWANLIFANFLAPNLPGLFDGQRFGAVNGALWTLKIEVMFYMVLPLLGWCLNRAGRAWWAVLLVLYAGAVVWTLIVSNWDHPLSANVARQLPGQMAFFASGMALWKLWALVKAQPGRFGLGGALLLALSFAHPLLEPLRAAGLAGLVGWAAFAPGPALNAARWGDISYGVYITHFPIVQTMIAVGLFSALGWPSAMALACLFVLVASLMLWWLVEKPALRKDSHYRQAGD